MVKPIYLLYIAIAIFLIWFFIFRNSGSNVGPDLAKCLKNKGAKFYGASWCPHCQNQKALFGSYAVDLPYIECSNSDGSQTKACTDAKVHSYPTWIFSDGTEIPGEMTIDELKQQSGC